MCAPAFVLVCVGACVCVCVCVCVWVGVCMPACVCEIQGLNIRLKIITKITDCFNLHAWTGV